LADFAGMNVDGRPAIWSRESIKDTVHIHRWDLGGLSRWRLERCLDRVPLFVGRVVDLKGGVSRHWSWFCTLRIPDKIGVMNWCILLDDRLMLVTSGRNLPDDAEQATIQLLHLPRGRVIFKAIVLCVTCCTIEQAHRRN
jgi:hypothetical protein